VQLKMKVIRALAPEASGFLLDPEFSIAHATVSGVLPGSVGMIANIERMRETEDGFERTVDLRPDWTPNRIAAAGADGAKFVFFHRAEEREASGDVERVRALVADCHAVGLPCIIEPLWYPLDGEDVADPKVQRARAEAIVASAARFAACGADVMKMQFPGTVGDAAARADAASAAQDLDAILDVPWVLLSEGVGFDDFAVQLELAAAGGASGFMAGRAVWKEAVATGGSDEAVALAAQRLAQLTAIIRADGRPWREPVAVAQVDASVAPSWWTAAV
jgi:tagatose-1,6-bisphosphate aldolase